MNRGTKSSFQHIQAAAENYRKSVIDVLKKYEAEKANAAEDVKQYKDEEGMLAARTSVLKTNARNAIKRAEQAFTGTVRTELDSLRTELANHLMNTPSQQFIHTLALYRDFGIVPGKAEISALVQMASGNTLGLRCLNSLLSSSKAGYTVVFPSSEDLCADLETIEKMSYGNIWYSPNALHSVALEVFAGQPVTFTRPDGTTYENGTTVNNITLITHRSFFESNLKALDAMAERWTDSVIPTIAQLDSLYPSGEAGKAEFESDQKSTADAAQIEKEPKMVDTGKSSAKSYDEVMAHYRH